MATKTNERELSSKIATWFQEHIQRNNFPFTWAGNEAGIKGEGTTKFGDVFLFRNRQANQVFTLIELKPPFGQKENLKVLEEKARDLKLRFVYTWDFRNLNVYELKSGKLVAAGVEHTPVLEKLEDWLRGDVQANIKGYIHRFCQEFIRFEETGKFSKFLPDKVYFVNLIRDFVKNILPHFESHIRLALTDKTKKAAIDEYVVKQGIAYSSDQDFIRLVAGQRVYGLATKIIFYQTIRRFFDDLPDLVLPDVDLSASILSAFEQAREKDWQAVFEAGPIEALGIPESAYGLFEEFLIELKVYHFGQLPEDVIGEVFQEIIDPEQRHTLGQYFTMEALVDFVIALVVNDPNGIYCDPTCGSGTFLIRLYDRLKYLSPGKTHKQLLDQIWGFDIGSFPAELSTINLFRQDASNFENFPRVRTTNIFDVHRGMEFDFPPPNSGKHYIKISTPLPPIDAFVGNFPFIRQELIEKKDQGFKKELTKLLAYEYLESYPQLFVQKNGIANAANTLAESPTPYNLKQTINHWVEKGDLELRLSGKADIYAYIYIHLTTLLADKGSFSIITSNSWLDTEYGHILKQFFLDHFCIKAIVASWAEPWFEDAAVNCVVTVLEREPNPQKRADNKVKFVKLKLGMAQMAEYGTEIWERKRRWDSIDSVVRTIQNVEYVKKGLKRLSDEESGLSSFENEKLNLRMVNQGFLNSEVETHEGNSKWGKYLRAPDIYFELEERLKNKLVPLINFGKFRRGYTTGINDFFYLQLVEGDISSNSIKAQNDAGWIGEIETMYLRKVIKSPKESEAVVVNSNKLPNLLFICDKTKDELLALNHIHALHYIEWGEKQHTDQGVAWPKVSSVSGRKLWYQINEKAPSGILLQMIGNDRYLAFLNRDRVHVDHNLFEYELDNPELLKQSEIYLNSTLFALIREVNSRANLGDGATKTEGVDWSNLMLIPDQKLDINYKPKGIFERKILPISKEIKLKDRQELDKAVLIALGLDPEVYLKPIYEGLCEMVSDRQELPKMRKKKKKEATKFAYGEVKSSVIKDCLPMGFRPFPQDFLVKEVPLLSLPTSGKTLHIKEHFLGTWRLSDGKQIVAETDSEARARYAVAFSINHPGTYQISLPNEPDDKTLREVLAAYESYLSELYEQIRADAYRKLHDWSLAEKLAGEVLGERKV